MEAQNLGARLLRSQLSLLCTICLKLATIVSKGKVTTPVEDMSTCVSNSLYALDFEFYKELNV